MKHLSFVALLFPLALVASPGNRGESPAIRAESLVKEALKVAKTKGTVALAADVMNPKGEFWVDQPETAPDLTLYSGSFIVLAMNHASQHVGMDHSRMPDATGAPILKRMQAFAMASGPGWLEYVGNDPTGHLKNYKAYVALQGSNLIVAVIPK